MESTTIRHDFSFPPKSANNGSNGGGNSNANRGAQYHYSKNMSKSVSTSLLSCAPATTAGAGAGAAAAPNRHVATGRMVMNSPGMMTNGCCYGCVSSGSANGGANNRHHRNHRAQYQQQQHQHSCLTPGNHQSPLSSAAQQLTNGIGAPGTPKDGNCSFTFDELKNTLSFMDDSPLVNPATTNSTSSSNNNNSSNSNHQMSTSTTTALMVNANMTVSAPANSSNIMLGENHSLHSGGSSSSGMSSASSYATTNSACGGSGSSGNNGSNDGGGLLMPKSLSNPMLLSTYSSASSLSSAASSSTSPMSSMTSSAVSFSFNRGSNGGGEKRVYTGGRHSVSSKPECRCGPSNSSSHQNLNNPHHHHHNHYHNSYHNQQHSPSSTSSLPPQAPPINHQSNVSNENAATTSSTLTSLIQPVPVAESSSSSSSAAYSTTNSIETAAKKYRFAAQNSEATCCWKGKLPPKQYKLPLVYSTKVFVGGLPWDICEVDLIKEFGVFGPCRIEWTNKDRYNMIMQHQQQPVDANCNADQQGFRHNRSMVNLKQQQHSSNSSSNIHSLMPSSSSSQPLLNNHHYTNQGDVSSANSNTGGNGNGGNGNKQRNSPGFAYVIYENEYSVRSLVSNCIEDYQNGRDRVEYYFKISTRRVRNKEVQIIPWILADNNFATCTPKDLDPKKTVFVGNLHGTMTARDLAHIMNELFGSVVYAGIDIDKLKYPIGSGRVTFAHQQNFMRAVRAAFVDIQTPKFAKRIQIDPYLEDVQCCLCMSDKGIYFCRDFQCFSYYCGACWEKQHSYNQIGNHKPLMRKREVK